MMKKKVKITIEMDVDYPELANSAKRASKFNKYVVSELSNAIDLLIPAFCSSSKNNIIRHEGNTVIRFVIDVDGQIIEDKTSSLIDDKYEEKCNP